MHAGFGVSHVGKDVEEDGGLDRMVAGEVMERRFAQKALGIAPIRMLLPGMINSLVFIRMSRGCCNIAANKPSKLTDFSLVFF